MIIILWKSKLNKTYLGLFYVLRFFPVNLPLENHCAITKPNTCFPGFEYDACWQQVRQRITVPVADYAKWAHNEILHLGKLLSQFSFLLQSDHFQLVQPSIWCIVRSAHCGKGQNCLWITQLLTLRTAVYKITEFQVEYSS